MTGLLIFGGTILLVVLAVSRYERRLPKAPQPWTNAVVDRDAQRISSELRSLTSYQSRSRPAQHRLGRHSAA